MTSIRCFLSRVAAGIQACKFAAIPVLALSLALVTTSAKAQTFKSDFATQVVLAGGGTDPVNTLTLLASPSTKPLMLTFPNAATAGTYVLSSDGSGHLVWANGSAGITLGGDVTGAANNNTIASTAGPDIAVAINAGAASAIHGSQVNPNFVAQNVSTTGTISGDGITSTVATGNALSLDNTGTPGAGVNDVTGTGGLWYVTNLGAATFASVNAGSGAITTTGAISGGGLTNTGAATTSGGTVSINSATGEADNTNIDASPATGGTNDIGNSGSTTNIAGSVTFSGPVTIPSGDLDLGLALNNIFVGNGATPSVAAPLAPQTNSVLITDALNGGTPQWAATLPSGLTYPAANITGAGSIGGSTSINTTGAIATTSTIGGGAITGTSLSAGSGTISGGAISGTTGTFTGAVSAVDLTSTDGLTSGGGSSNLNNADADAVNIGNGTSEGNAIGIGNGTGNSATYSTTTLAGLINVTGTTNFTGPVNIPAGDLNLGLATNNIYIGNGSNIATGAPVTGDVSATLTSGNAVLDVNSVQTAAGSSIVTAINTSGGAGGINGSQVNPTFGSQPISTSGTIGGGAITGTSLSAGSGTISGGAISGTTGTFTGAVSAVDLTSTAGLTSGGGSSNLNNADNDAVNIGSGASETNAIAIGNGTGNSGTFSTTTLAGLINITGDANFTGPVNIPAGDLNLGLAQNNIFVGNVANIAAPLAPTNSRVLVADASGNVSWGATLPTGLTVSGETMNNETIGGTTSISTSGSIATTGSGSLSVAGQTTLASTNLSSQGVTAAATTALSNGSFFQLTCLSSVAITTLTGGNIGTAGQIIVLLNANASGSGIYITLTAGGTLALNGGNVIMGPGGSATLISDGTNWHLMSAE